MFTVKMSLFDVSLAEKGLRTKYLGRKVVHRPVTVTTMNDAEDGARQGDPNGTVHIADRMTGARGTKGRSWVAESNGNLYMSFVLHMELPQDIDPTTDRCREFDIDVAGAIATLQALEAFGLNGVKVKWLNDLWIRGHKLLGALTEYKGKITVETKEYHLYILGLGLNINCDMRREPAMHNISTSIMCELGHSVSREEMFSEICNFLEPLLELDRRELLKLYKTHEVIRSGNQVKVYRQNEIKVCTVGGVKDDWSMDLKDENGEYLTFQCTEVSLRPVREKVVYVLRDSGVETWSSDLLLKTCSALVDTQVYEVATMAIERINLENLSPCALVVIGQLKDTSATSKYVSTVLDYIKKGGACLCIGNACSLFELNAQVLPKGEQFVPKQELTPSVIKTYFSDPSSTLKASTNLCMFLESCQYSKEHYKSSSIIARRCCDTSGTMEHVTVNECNDCAQHPSDIVVYDIGKGKICFCRPNVEISYADIDVYFPQLHDKKFLLQETVYQRDCLFVEILKEIAIL